MSKHKNLVKPSREPDFCIPPNEDCGYLGFDVWVDEQIYCIYDLDDKSDDGNLYDHICTEYTHVKNPVDHIIDMCDRIIDGEYPTTENINYHKDIKRIVEDYVVDKVILEN
jgi:hypothetical protein